MFLKAEHACRTKNSPQHFDHIWLLHFSSWTHNQKKPKIHQNKILLMTCLCWESLLLSENIRFYAWFFLFQSSRTRRKLSRNVPFVRVSCVNYEKKKEKWKKKVTGKKKQKGQRVSQVREQSTDRWKMWQRPTDQKIASSRCIFLKHLACAAQKWHSSWRGSLDQDTHPRPQQRRACHVWPLLHLLLSRSHTHTCRRRSKEN